MEYNLSYLFNIYKQIRNMSKVNGQIQKLVAHSAQIFSIALSKHARARAHTKSKWK